MNQNYPGTQSLQARFQKTCRQISALWQAGKAFSFSKLKALIKRRDRYAKQLLLQPSVAFKTGSALLLASALHLSSHAQVKYNYVRADSANPVRRAGLPQGLWQPTFVDIDNDGDLDCFESSANRENGGTPLIKVTFLRNTGSSKHPYYELDTTTGFPRNIGTAAPYNSTLTRLRFVDIDNDGDYDLFAGSYYSNFGAYGRVQYFKNTGTAKKANFVNTPTENVLGGIRGSYSLQFSFADFDQDGDYDLLTTDLYRTKFYKNVGTPAKAQFEFEKISYAFFYPTFSVYDYNKDGRPDVFDGYSGGVIYYRNIGAPGQLRFTIDPKNTPAMPPNFVTFGFVDLNKDGIAEAFSEDGHYAVAIPNTAADKQAASVTNVAAEASIKAYPNPFTDHFVLTLENASPNTVIKITDIQGKTISTTKASSNVTQLGSGLQKGIYMVQVMQNDAILFTQKIIKQ